MDPLTDHSQAIAKINNVLFGSRGEINFHGDVSLGVERIGTLSVVGQLAALTVEINNTDAEGRLLLADGVAYAAKHLNPEVVIDMATLTGASGLATGHLHAAIVSNDEGLEQRAVRSGRKTGDLVHPLIFCPELHKGQFKSEVADLTNSVKVRTDAPVSAAGWFVYENLRAACGDGKIPSYLHVDMAFPVTWKEGRASGYGVALVADLLGVFEERSVGGGAFAWNVLEGRLSPPGRSNGAPGENSTGESAEQGAATEPGAKPIGPRLNAPRKFERRHKLSVRTDRAEQPPAPSRSPTGSAPPASSEFSRARKARTKTRPPRQEYHYPFKWYDDSMDSMRDHSCAVRSFQNRSAMEILCNQRRILTPDVVNCEKTSSYVVERVEDARLELDSEVFRDWPCLRSHDTPVMLRPRASSGDQNGATGEFAREMTIGVMLTGVWGPASGIHNVVLGINDHLKQRFQKYRLLGFMDGPSGFASRRFLELNKMPNLGSYANQGGSDLLRYGSLRAMDEGDFKEIHGLCREYGLHGLVVAGGPAEISHVSQLVCYFETVPDAERVSIISVFQSPNCNVYVPNWLPITLGFDSAMTVSCEFAGNLSMDGLSSGRHIDYHFIRCGSSTATLEVALQVRPTYTILAEDLPQCGPDGRVKTLRSLVRSVANLMIKRYQMHRLRSGTILISDGFYDFLPHFGDLERECRQLQQNWPDIDKPPSIDDALRFLSPPCLDIFIQLPRSDQDRLVKAYDKEGKPIVVETEPERLLAMLVMEHIRVMNEGIRRRNAAKDIGGGTSGPGSQGGSSIAGTESYDEDSIQDMEEEFPIPCLRVHYLGQEARCPLPSKFDSQFGWVLGQAAAALAVAPEGKYNGYIAVVTDLLKDTTQWGLGGIPLAPLLRKQKEPELIPIPAIAENKEAVYRANQKLKREAKVLLVSKRQICTRDDHVMNIYNKLRMGDMMATHSRQPGPYQFEGPLSDGRTISLLAAYMPPEDIIKRMELPSIPAGTPTRKTFFHMTSRSGLLAGTRTGIISLPRRYGGSSPLQVERAGYQPLLPRTLSSGLCIVSDREDIPRRASMPLLRLAFPYTCNVTAVSIEPQRTGEVPVEIAGAAPAHGRLPEHSHSVKEKRVRSQTVAFADPDVASPTDITFPCVEEEEATPTSSKHEDRSAFERKRSLYSLFQANTLRIGIVYMGRQSPGCHNVVWGLKSYVDAHPGGCLIGIALGALGFVKGYTVTLDSDDLLSLYRNQAGLDLLGRTDLTLRTTEDLVACARTCQKLALDGVVVVGGVGTHADTALLAETMAKLQVPTRVVGVPASVENDIPLVEQTLGYDTACKIFSNIIGNIATLAASGTREWYFIRICGRSMSHIAAECALHAHPNLFLISEEIRARNMSLHDLIHLVCDVILKRCQQGMDYGVVLIPESVTDALDELKELEEEIRSMHAQEHRLLMSSSTGVKPSTMLHRSLFETLSPSARAMYDSLPDRIQYVLWQQYVATPPGGQFELPHLESELLLKSLVALELPRRRHRLLQGDPLLPRLAGNRIIDDFAACCHTHSLHIQGRSAMPSNFDADLGYTMGYGAGVLIHAGRGGLLVSAEGLEKDAADWSVVGVPLTSLVSVSLDEDNSECQ
ncbi:hypothetical protein FOZ62_012769, partial [Perkinsus olseni]